MKHKKKKDAESKNKNVSDQKEASDTEQEPEAQKPEEEKDPVETLKEELRQKEEALTEKKNEYLRLLAETENFKKRMRKEKEEHAQYANEKLLKELVIIHENLERALEAPNPSVESLRQGVEMILKQFDAFLEKEKVVPMKAVGEPFDPTIHEVLCQEPSNQHQENTITQEYSKGYFYNGRVLRPAKVVIAKSSSGSDEKAPEEESPEESEKDS